MSKIIDLQGQKFGRLTVLGLTPNRKNGGKVWLCRCECGKEKEVRAYSLTSGSTTSCGCFSMQLKVQQLTTHNMSTTRQYRIWAKIIERCSNKKARNYKNWGGRCITYDPKWETFEGFWEDMNEGYSDKLTIDRIDNDGNYCKVNCRWATPMQQANNKRNNRRITHNNKTLTLAEWERESGIPDTTIDRRLRKGWSVWDALTIPTKQQLYEINLTTKDK